LFQWMRENLKVIMIIVVVVFLATCGVMYGIGGGKKDGPNPGKPVVKINGDKIPRIDVEKTALLIAERMAAQGHIQINEEVMADCRKKAVDNMALEMELKKEIKDRKIKVTRKEVKEQLNQIEAQFPSKEEFKNYVERSGKSMRDIKRDIKFQLQQQKLVEQVTDNVKISDDEVKKFYEQGKDTFFKQPAGCKLLIATFGNKSSAELARKAIAGGAKWDGIMKEQKAEQSSKEDKPDFVPNEQFAQAPFSSIKSLEPGQLSEVIEIPGTGKYMIVRMLGKEEERILGFDEVKEQIVQMLKGQQGRFEVLKLARKLKNRANIEVLDKAYFEAPKKEAAPAQPAAPAAQEAPAAPALPAPAK